MKILLIGDSFGCPRTTDNNALVSEEETWPYLLKQEFSDNKDIRIHYDFRPFRRLEQIIPMLSSYKGYDLVVIHAGIVDTFPRPLPARIFTSRTLPAKILRKLVGLVRKGWMRHVYSKPIVNKDQLIEKLKICIDDLSPAAFLLINISRQYHESALSTYKQREYIEAFNSGLAEIGGENSRVSVFDLYENSRAEYFSALDSHFNVEGNRFICRVVRNYIEGLIKK